MAHEAEQKTSRFVEDPEFVRKYDIRLAMEVGENVAILIQQLHYHIKWKEETYGVGEWRSTATEWAMAFPHWHEATIKRALKSGVEIGAIRIRRGVFRGRQAVWYSLDHRRIEELGNAGEEKVLALRDRISGEIKERKRIYQMQNAPHEEVELGSKMLPLGGAKCSSAGVQNEHHLVNLSSTSVSSTINRGRDAKASLDTVQEELLEDPQRTKIRQKHCSTWKRKFEKSQSNAALENLWKVMIIDSFGRGCYTPFSPADKKNNKTHFVPWCEKAGVDLIEFLQWCISNWNVLRDHKMPWANLGDYPTFKTIYALKDKFLEHYRKNGGSHDQHEVKTVKKTVYSLNDIPLDHPHFKQLKIIFDRMGRVEI